MPFSVTEKGIFGILPTIPTRKILSFERYRYIDMEKIYLYNTLTKTVDEFRTHEPGKVKMYTCGPTVYHFAHIGNLRS